LNDETVIPLETIARVAESARKLLGKYNLCSSCLGRQYALLGRGITNYKRGESIKLYLTMIGCLLYELQKQDSGIELLKLLAEHGNFQPAISSLDKFGISIDSAQVCYICENLMEKIDIYSDLILEQLQKWEYKTFLIGSKVPELIIDREDNLRAEFDVKYGESIKAELNREIGKKMLGSGKEVDFDSPDIVAVINPITEEIEVNVNPIFIYGRYQKLKRGISQTRWICWNCEGKGCDECNGTGRRYEHSVEEFIAEPILKVAEGIDYKFHGSGREDIDARMLGTGRPFVVEIKEPRKRNLDLIELEKKINEFGESNVQVSELEWSDRETVRNIKALAQVSEKTYKLIVETQDSVTIEALQDADAALTGALIEQKTPQRVMHRRADKLRIKKVYEVKTTQIAPRKLEVIVRCQGGCYVKELCNGDDGRTNPSLSALLKTPINVLELDVLNVE
jgi:tRNA pseudouridine synthase 10